MSGNEAMFPIKTRVLGKLVESIKFSLRNEAPTKRIKLKIRPLRVGAYKGSLTKTEAQVNIFQPERAPFDMESAFQRGLRLKK